MPVSSERMRRAGEGVSGGLTAYLRARREKRDEKRLNDLTELEKKKLAEEIYQSSRKSKMDLRISKKQIEHIIAQIGTEEAKQGTEVAKAERITTLMPHEAEATKALASQRTSAGALSDVQAKGVSLGNVQAEEGWEADRPVREMKRVSAQMITNMMSPDPPLAPSADAGEIAKGVAGIKTGKSSIDPEDQLRMTYYKEFGLEVDPLRGSIKVTDPAKLEQAVDNFIQGRKGKPGQPAPSAGRGAMDASQWQQGGGDEYNPADHIPAGGTVPRMALPEPAREGVDTELQQPAQEATIDPATEGPAAIAQTILNSYPNMDDQMMRDLEMNLNDTTIANEQLRAMAPQIMEELRKLKQEKGQ